MQDIETQANNILLRARQQADQLLIAAQKHAEQLKRQAIEHGRREGQSQGLREGTQQGLKNGHDQAVNEARAQLTQLIQSMTQAMRQIETQRGALEAEAVTGVIELAMAIARRVTKRQAQIDPGVLSANLVEALKLVVRAADLRVAVHPSQRQMLLKELPNLQMDWPNLAHVELIDDPAISPGGCKIHTRQGLVSADLDEQLDRVMANLLPAKADQQ